jgi:hypothetical protein
MAEGCVLDSLNSRWAPMVGSVQHSNELSGSITGRENLDVRSLLPSHERFLSIELVKYVIPYMTMKKQVKQLCE